MRGAARLTHQALPKMNPGAARLGCYKKGEGVSDFDHLTFGNVNSKRSMPAYGLPGYTG